MWIKAPKVCEPLASSGLACKKSTWGWGERIEDEGFEAFNLKILSYLERSEEKVAVEHVQIPSSVPS